MVTYQKALQNFRKVFNRSTLAERIAGITWYEDAAHWAEEVAYKYTVSKEIVTAVTAVISPGQSWEINKRASEALISTYRLEGFGALKIPGYPRNVEKAKLMLRLYWQNSDWKHLVTGPKVSQFWKDLQHPAHVKEEVTIDFHIYSAAAGIRYTTKGTPNIRKSERSAINRAIITLAEEAAGFWTPAAVQATIWLVWKRIGGK